MIALFLTTNSFSSKNTGFNIVSLSIFKVEIVFPLAISITNNLPLFVER